MNQFRYGDIVKLLHHAFPDPRDAKTFKWRGARFWRLSATNPSKALVILWPTYPTLKPVVMWVPVDGLVVPCQKPNLPPMPLWAEPVGDVEVVDG